MISIIYRLGLAILFSLWTALASGQVVSFNVGGNASGLDAFTPPPNLTTSINLTLNSSTLVSPVDLTLSNDGGFTFSSQLTNGADYDVTVSDSVLGLTCQVTNGSGIVNNADITDIIVTCAASPVFTVGGSISGLDAFTPPPNVTTSIQLTLTSNIAPAELQTFNADGPFTFATQLPTGATYDVTLSNSVQGLICQVTNGAGTIAAANVTDIQVDCSITPSTPVATPVPAVPLYGLIIMVLGILAVARYKFKS